MPGKAKRGILKMLSGLVVKRVTSFLLRRGWIHDDEVGGFSEKLSNFLKAMIDLESSGDTKMLEKSPVRVMRNHGSGSRIRVKVKKREAVQGAKSTGRPKTSIQIRRKTGRV